MKKIILFIILLFIFNSNIVFTEDKVFTLKESLNIALNNNLQLQGAKEKLNEARAKIKEAKSFRYLTLSLDSTYTRLNEAPYMDMSKFPSSPFTFYNSAGTVNIPGMGDIPITQLQISGMEVQTSTDYIVDTMSKLGQTLDPASQGILQQMLLNNYVMKSSSSGGKFYMADVNVYDTKVTFKQPIYTFGRIEQGIKLSKLGESANRYEYLRTEQEVIFNVKKAYFGILQAKHFIEVAQAAVNNVEEHLTTVNNLYQQGMIARYDVLRAEVGLADAKQLLITAKNALNIAKAGFALVLGGKFNPEEIDVEDIDIKINESQIQNLKLEDLISQACKNRPEILQLNTNIKMAKGAINLVKANDKPILALVGNYDYKKGDATPIEWKDSWNVTMALSFPFFDSGATYAKVKQAESQYNYAKNGLELLKQGIALEVRIAYLELIAAKEKIETVIKGIEQAEEGLRIADERYENGMGTQVEVTDARTSLTQSRTNYFNSIYEYQLSYAKLEKAVGTPIENLKLK